MKHKKKYILFICSVLVIIFGYKLLPSTAYPFLYADRDYCNRDYEKQNDNTYQVEQNTLIKIPKVCSSNKELKLFLYKNGENKELTYEEAQKFILDPNTQSPDGYNIIFQKRHSFIGFITENSYWNTYLQKNSLFKKKIAAHISNGSKTNFYFLGWVVGEQNMKEKKSETGGLNQTPEQVLTGFFEFLSKRDYTNALKLFYPLENVTNSNEKAWELLKVYSPRDQNLSREKDLEYYCTGTATCLPVEILSVQKISGDSYLFLVQFREKNGDIMSYGPFGGMSEKESPPQKQFPFEVQKVDGNYKVITPPLYRP